MKSILSKLVARSYRKGFWKLQSVLPNYLKRRYYPIQKGIKGVSKIIVYLPLAKSFDLLKYLLYFNTATPRSKSANFSPSHFKKFFIADLIKSIAKGYMARKRYLASSN